MDHSVALVFLNNDQQSQPVTCDQKCFSTLGFAASTRFIIRDLWSHRNIGSATAKGFTTPPLPPNGSMLLKFFPRK